MNEPKKRGRPSNAEKAAREKHRWEGEAPEPDLNAVHRFEPVDTLGPGGAVSGRFHEITAAQAYAMRVWEGQSPSAMETKERLQRVREALEGQNLPTEGVTLPGDLKL